MEPELLVCDIGNTSIKIGLANKDRVISSYALPANNEETSDSIGLSLLSILEHSGVAQEMIKACATSSVVPEKDSLLGAAIARYIGCSTLFAPRDLPVPLENRYSRPEQVGADRLVGAYSARQLYPQPESLIVVDYGTAVTFDCVSKRTYLGGLIFPGPITSMAALGRHTAKLPAVDLLDIRPQQPVPGLDTITSIQHGLIFGFADLTEGLCSRLKRQLEGSVKILATGGFAAPIANVTNIFDAVVPSLVLEGLRRLYFEAKD